MSDLTTFIDLSSALTGFSPLQLAGTGVAENYLGVLDSILAPDIFRELLAQAAVLSNEPGDEAVSRFLGDDRFGPVLRNIILLWYTGSWNALPDDWRSQYGTSPLDVTQIVSVSGYQSGLQWIVAGGHAAGANHQGFGAWSLPPQGGAA